MTNENELVYCLKCKQKCEIKDASIKTTKNNRKFRQGNCITCNSKCNQFLISEKPKIEELLEDKKE